MSQAIASFLSMGGNEIINAARTKSYIDNGIAPRGFNFRCDGCEGLIDILPCLDSYPPSETGCYSLPELDDAPWYDPVVPESKNFAGLFVNSATISAPYSRTTTDNIGVGQTLGRLKLNGRAIVVDAWLVGKTCCAVQYGLSWLTSVLADPPCDGGDCAGSDLDFLSCCPNIGGEDDCITTIIEDESGECAYEVFVRPDAETEFQRAQDFFRRMHGAGVIAAPNILEMRGNTCGCGCATMTRVEFTIGTSDPYFYHLAETFLPEMPAPSCPTDDECDIIWDVSNSCGTCGATDCLEDPQCTPSALPPVRGLIATTCGCSPLQTARISASVAPAREWGSTTLNFEVYAGDSDLRNLTIKVFQNPTEHDCSDADFFDDCSACLALTFSYVPAGGTLRFSGEERRVTIDCGGAVRNARSSVSGMGDRAFEWPELTCVQMCVAVEFDCENTAENATIMGEFVDRDL